MLTLGSPVLSYGSKVSVTLLQKKNKWIQLGFKLFILANILPLSHIFAVVISISPIDIHVFTGAEFFYVGFIMNKDNSLLKHLF